MIVLFKCGHCGADMMILNPLSECLQGEKDQKQILRCPVCGMKIGQMLSTEIFLQCGHWPDDLLPEQAVLASLEIYANNEEGIAILGKIEEAFSQGRQDQMYEILGKYPKSSLKARIALICPHCRRLLGKILIKGSEKEFLREMKRLAKKQRVGTVR